MKKIYTRYISFLLVLMLVFSFLLIPVAEASSKCSFCGGKYKRTRYGGTEVLYSQRKYMNAGHYIRYYMEQAVYVVCDKNPSGHRTNRNYWTDWQLMGY